MILQALMDYYDRKASDPNSGIAPPGWEVKEIRFIITLDAAGHPILLEDTEETINKKKRSKSFLVPQVFKRSSGIGANLLWDNPEYVLGVDLKGKPERVKEQFVAFKKRILGLELPSDEGIASVLLFLDRENPAAELVKFGEVWKSVLESGTNLTFRLQGDECLVCNRPRVKQAVDQALSHLDKNTLCILTGKPDALENTHPSIKNVWGAQSVGANIVSFNAGAFKSFGKEQGANAPVGKGAAFAYTTALNHLLRKGSTQRMQVGDASTVFWSERQTDFEDQFAAFFSEPTKDNPDQHVDAVKALLNSPKSGTLPALDTDQNNFFVLGLSPNASRISIRFWIVATVSEMQEHIRQHFSDLEIVHGQNEKPVLSIFRLLISTATLGKADNIPPHLEGELMRCILEGLPYPSALLQAVVRRIKTEHEISFVRAALIKACINRNVRFKNNNHQEELKVSLDTSNASVGYRLGRLFAVLEKIQEEANPGINATIRDRYYAAASSSPVTVFSRLMTLKNHHLSKLENVGRRVNLERLTGEIVSALADFPAHLNLEDQGRFAIGYYHQKQDFYTKKEKQD